MKTSKISTLFFAFAMVLSLNSFASDKKANVEEKETLKSGSINAAIYKISDTNKVRLSINKNPNDRLRVVLKDKAGKVYYSEIYKEQDDKYRRVFNLDEIGDGTYYFELSNKKNKVVKEIQIQSTVEKLISLQ